MINLKLRLGKKDRKFIQKYIRAGFAETEQEAIRHALLLFSWNQPWPSPENQAAERPDARMKRKMARFCEALVAAFRIACTRRGMLRLAKA